MHPAIAGLQAIFTALRAGLYSFLDLIQMSTGHVLYSTIKRHHPATRLQMSQTFRPVITRATKIARLLIQALFTNSPILARLEVNATSGKTAKGNWMESTTWLAIRS